MAEKDNTLITNADGLYFEENENEEGMTLNLEEDLQNKLAGLITDRFKDSTIAYQGFGNGLKLDVLEVLQESIFNKFNPDLTIILDIPPEISLKRAKKRKTGKHKYEKMSIIFHKKVRKGFLEIAKKNKHRCKVLNANGNKKEINQNILRIIQNKFHTKLF